MKTKQSEKTRKSQELNAYCIFCGSTVGQVSKHPRPSGRGFFSEKAFSEQALSLPSAARIFPPRPTGRGIQMRLS